MVSPDPKATLARRVVIDGFALIRAVGTPRSLANIINDLTRHVRRPRTWAAVTASLSDEGKLRRRTNSSMCWEHVQSRSYLRSRGDPHPSFEQPRQIGAAQADDEKEHANQCDRLDIPVGIGGDRACLAHELIDGDGG
jgi:hypothetical protein